jgi:hypothetical protein
MGKASKVESELMEAAGIETYESKVRKEQIGELVEKAATLDDDAWNSLSEEAQNWFNEAVECVNQEKETPPFPGEAKAAKGKEEKPAAKKEAAKPAAKPAAKAKAKKEEPADDKAESDAEEEADAEDEKPAKAAKPAKEKAAKAEKPAKAAKEVKERKPSSVNRIRELAVETPDATYEQVLASAREEGLTVADATVAAVFADTHKTLRVVRDSGKFNIYE